MTQKFILSAQKTVKKSHYFEQEKQKRFSRKRSDRQKSYDSKKSKEDSVFSQYIRNPNQISNLKINLVDDDSFNFLEGLSTTIVPPVNEAERRSRKTMYNRTNNNRQSTREECTLTLRIKILQTQLKAKEGEAERYKSQIDEEKQRRRKAQLDRKHLSKELGAFEKRNEDMLLQIKKLTKQKDILNKQIEFLEKINYDEKTRNIQSYRQKHLQEEIFKLRQQLNSRKSIKQLDFEKEMQTMRHLKEVAEERFRSMQSLVAVQKRKLNCLKEDMLDEKTLTKEKIVNSPQYRELRDRFKKFIDQYKQVRVENHQLKALLEGKQEELILSDQECSAL